MIPEEVNKSHKHYPIYTTMHIVRRKREATKQLECGMEYSGNEHISNNQRLVADCI